MPTGMSGLLIGVMRLVRIPFLLLGFLLFLSGALLALNLHAPFSLGALLLGYAILLTAQLSVHLSNDYFDLGTDLLSEPTPFSGGTGVLTTMPELRAPSRRAAIAMLVLSVVLGALFAAWFSDGVPSGALFLSYVVIGNLLSWGYTAPPMRMVYRGFGELAVGLGVGVMWAGLGYLVVMGGFDVRFLLFALPMLLYVIACIVCTEVPDMEADRTTGKMTLVARRGEGPGYTLAAVTGVLSPLVYIIAALAWDPVPGVSFLPLAIIFILPAGASVLGKARRPGDRPALVNLIKALMLSLFIAVILTDIYFLGTFRHWSFL